MATSIEHSGWLPKWSNETSGSVLRLSRLVNLNTLNMSPGAHNYVQHSVDSANTFRLFAETLECEVRIRDMAVRRGLTKLSSHMSQDLSVYTDTSVAPVIARSATLKTCF
jgi:hypothetical protein